jgi:hypothetical protein
MALRIISADERLSRPSKINIALFGPSGVGKTTLARTLDPETTLFVDLEAGTLALQDWRGDVFDIREAALQLGADPWELARGLACLLSGPDPSDVNGAYSQRSYESYKAAFGDLAERLTKYNTIFWDSITVASRLCFAWAKRQPEAFSEKTGKPDNRGAYGLLGQEMVRWLTVIQHTPGKSIVVVGILNRVVDDLKRASWEPQIEGSKTGQELPGIFDQVLTLQNFTTDDGRAYRALVTQQNNPDGYPAKDRSGRLDPIEPPDLGLLMRKIQTANRGGARFAIETTIPTTTATAPEGSQ